jgi:hypothetical protein
VKTSFGTLLLVPESTGKALVLCCDETNLVSSAGANLAGFAAGDGHIRTQTLDYYRHSTVTLFAALSYLDSKIFRQMASRHRHQEWLSFLKQLDRQTPSHPDASPDSGQLCDAQTSESSGLPESTKPSITPSYGRDRFLLHFTPTSSSWMNLVERFSRDVPKKPSAMGASAACAS